MSTRRRTAIWLASGAACALVAAEIIDQIAWRTPFNLLYWAATFVAIGVIVMGVWLLAQGDQLGTALLVVAGATALPVLAFDLFSLTFQGYSLAPIEHVMFGFRLLHGIAILVAAWLAWSIRPREAWTWSESLSGIYVLAAVVVFAAGDLWSIRLLLPPVAVSNLPMILQLLVSASVLIAAARLPRRLAAGALIAAIAPGLAAGLFTLYQTLLFGGAMVGLSGIAETLGRAVLIALALRWLGIGSHNLGPEPIADPA